MPPLRRFGIATLLLAALASAVPARAQEADDLEARREATLSEQSRIAREMALSTERIDRMNAEIAALGKDMGAINAALIQAAKTEKKLTGEIDDIAGTLAEQEARRDAVKTSLNARRGLLAQVLAALQRMGLNPPPALLVRPEDALASVRSAILLGSVVPGLREETRVLLADLQELQRITASIAADRDRLSATVAAQAEEKKRLTLLLEIKKDLQARSQVSVETETHQREVLSARVATLQDLIEAIESETSRRDRAGRAVSQPAPPSILAATPFASLTGRVVAPVAGRFARRFGQSDGHGAHMLGDTVQTQSGAIVTSPCDGVVLYAGPFRSYGQLLILDAGDGYHLVLAGMGNIGVSSGQSVLTGEPVGAMGETRLASAVAYADEGQLPVLYVEFRKDGKPVDPSPWWAPDHAGRTGNGT
jgi:septal ring factor EnvC (AmiA/AmiB activator)